MHSALILLNPCGREAGLRHPVEKLLELEKVEFEKVVAKSDFLEPNLPL